MSFRFPRVAVLFGITLSWGCTLETKEPPAAAPNIGIGGNLYLCLTGYDQKLRNYFRGAQDSKEERQIYAETDQLFNCAKQALTLFADSTKGALPEAYTRVELKKFLERYFLGQDELSDELVSEAMELKVALLGGKSESLTKTEIDRTIDLLSVFQYHTLKLSHYQPLVPSHTNHLSPAEMDQLVSTLEEAGKGIGEAFQKISGFYSFQRLEALLHQIQLVYEQNGEGTGPRLLREKLPTFVATKNVLMSPDGKGFRPEEWEHFFRVSVKWFSIYLRFEHIRASYPSLISGQGLTRLISLVSDLRYLVLDALDHHPDSTISFDLLKEWVKRLDKDGYLPRIVSRKTGELVPSMETIENFIPILFKRLLGGLVGGPQGRDAVGANRGALDRAWYGFDYWAEGQKELDSIFERLGGDAARESLGFLPTDLKRTLGELGRTGSRASADLQRVFSEFLPIFRGDDTLAYFPWPSDGQRVFYDEKINRLHSFHNLSEMHWMRSLVRVLLQGYSEDRDRGEAGAGGIESELVALYDDLRPLGTELLFVDPRDRAKSSPNLRFLEGNLFTFHAGPDTQVLTLDEGIELLSFLLSAKRMAGRIHEEIALVCPKGELDVAGYPLIDGKCFRDHFFLGVEQYWDHLPGMVQYYRSLDAAGRIRFFHDLGVATGWASDPKNPDPPQLQLTESTVSEAYSLLAHYVEAVFVRYDKNHSGTLDNVETLEAYKVFGSVLRALRPTFSEASLQNLLLYIVKYGQLPGVDWLWWNTLASKQFDSSDRGMVIKVFATIQQEIAMDPKILQTLEGDGP